MLEQRIALITGASRGLGKAIATLFFEQGASLVLCARTYKEIEALRTSLLSQNRSGQAVVAVEADVSNPLHVDQIFERVESEFSALDILVNNAGIYGPFGPLETNSFDEWVRAFEINLFGTVLCCKRAIPMLKKQQRGKIINLSGGGATKPMPFISAYAASKAAIVRFTETVAEELKQDGIDVNAIAPGPLATAMLDQALAAGPERIGSEQYQKFAEIKKTGGAPLQKGAALALFLASRRSDGITGKLLSALWDPWESLPEHLNTLQSTDVYALRRIEPSDRKISWSAL